MTFVKCECGEWIDLDDCVYTNIAPTEDPRIMVYAPTCGVCGKKHPDKDNHAYPCVLPHNWIGSLEIGPYRRISLRSEKE